MGICRQKLESRLGLFVLLWGRSVFDITFCSVFRNLSELVWIVCRGDTLLLRFFRVRWYRIKTGLWWSANANTTVM